MSEIKFKFTPDDGRFKKLKFRLGLVCCQLCRFASMESKEREVYCMNCVISDAIAKTFREAISTARETIEPESEVKKA